MTIKNYDQLSSLELDTLKEIGSIGTGNAATSLSALIGKPVRIQMPEVRIMGYNEAIEWIGGPEEITAGVLVGMSGQISGIMLSVQQLEFVNLVLDSMLGQSVGDYMELQELEHSALTEVGNIMISTFINALSGLAGIDIAPTVSAFSVDMVGAIMPGLLGGAGRVGASCSVPGVGCFVQRTQCTPLRLGVYSHPSC